MANIPPWFLDTSKIKTWPFIRLDRLEALAVELGHKLSRLDGKPYERKKVRRIKPQTVRLNALSLAEQWRAEGFLIRENLAVDAQAEHNTTSDAPPIVDSTPLATPQQGT